MNVASIAVSVLLALLLLATGGGKLAGAASSLTIRDSLRLPSDRWKAIGVAEMVLVVAFAAGVWFRPIGVLAAFGVVVLMIGAIAARRSVGGPEQRSGIIADVVVFLVAAAAVGLGAAST